MFNKEQIRQYFRAFLLALAVAGVFSLYLFLRREYFDLYILNKVLASASLVLLGIVLLIGPISRFYNRFDKWLIYRREIGIMAFLLALTHGIISSSQRNNPGMIWGLVGLAILAILFATSFEKIIDQIRRPFWIWLQSWGVRIATLLVFIHLIILKYSGWVKWLKEGGSSDLARPNFPPASLLGALFIGFVAMTRLAEIFGVKIARKIFGIGLILLILSIIILFILGL